jgi:hypothetical protein
MEGYFDTLGVQFPVPEESGKTATKVGDIVIGGVGRRRTVARAYTDANNIVYQSIVYDIDPTDLPATELTAEQFIAVIRESLPVEIANMIEELNLSDVREERYLYSPDAYEAKVEYALTGEIVAMARICRCGSRASYLVNFAIFKPARLRASWDYLQMLSACNLARDAFLENMARILLFLNSGGRPSTTSSVEELPTPRG